MKRLTAAAVLFLFLITAAACAEPGGQGGKAPAESIETEITSAPADSYSEYASAKAEALDNLLQKAEADEELYTLMYESLTPLTEADITLMPIKAIGKGEEESSELEGFGITGVAVSQGGDGIRVKSSREEGPLAKGGDFELTCAYYAASESMQASASGDKGGDLFFEYERRDTGYASQYYIKESSVNITMFMDGGNVALGVKAAQERPASILGGGVTSDFVKNDVFYCMLSGGKLTVFNNGEEKTY